MKTTLFLCLMACLPAASAFSAEGDLELPGERWLAKFDRYVCDYDKPSAQPAELADLKVNFEKASTDFSLDNVLITASFEQNGVACRYSAILLADNAAFTARLVDSKAFNAEGADCSVGKATLDRNLAANNYLYYGHPHRIAVMMPVADAEAVCGAGKNSIGAEFVLSGRKQE
jgi:hypothetical protein